MSDTVKKRRSLLLPELVPSRAAIRLRMADRFGGWSPMVREIVEPCAEEAERIIFELLRDDASLTLAVIVKKTYSTGGKLRKARYECPCCQWSTIRLHDQHCAGCGVRIEWK